MTSLDSELKPLYGDIEDSEPIPFHDPAQAHEIDFKLIVDVEKLERDGIKARSIIGYRSHLPDGPFIRRVHRIIHNQKPEGTNPG